MEAFCYRKKKAQKAQAHRSSQGTSGSSSGISERSFTGSETHELLMLLHRLVTSTSSEVVGSVTQPSALTGFATASQFSTFGLPSALSPSTYPRILILALWHFLSYDSSFCSSFFFTSVLPPLHCSYHQWIPSFYC
jgi:hypothetical protein